MKKICIILIALFMVFNVGCSSDTSNNGVENSRTENAEKKDVIVENVIESGMTRYKASSGLSVVASDEWTQIDKDLDKTIRLEKNGENFDIVKKGRVLVSLNRNDYLRNFDEPVNLTAAATEKLQCAMLEYSYKRLEDSTTEIDGEYRNYATVKYHDVFDLTIPILVENYGSKGFSIEADIYFDGCEYLFVYESTTQRFDEEKYAEFISIVSTLEDEKKDFKEMNKLCEKLTGKTWKYEGDDGIQHSVEFIPDSTDIASGQIFVDSNYLGEYYANYTSDDGKYIGVDMCILAYPVSYATLYTSVEFDKKGRCEIYSSGSDNTYLLE